MLVENETLTAYKTPNADVVPAEDEQRGQAPFFSPDGPEPLPENISVEEFIETAGGAEYLGLPEDEPSFVESLEEAINAFRFPGDKSYKKLDRAEIAAIPSVESQVIHVEETIQQWLGDTLTYAESVEYDPQDAVLTDAAMQIEHLVGQAHVVEEQLGYWRQFYETWEPSEATEARPHNEVGRFTKWASRRTARTYVAPLVAKRRRAAEKTMAEGMVQMPIEPDYSDLAKNKELRRRTYQSRMDTKIGLAAARVFTDDRLALIAELLPFPPDETTTPEIIRRSAQKVQKRTTKPSISELLAKLELPELPTPEPEEDLIPF